MAMLPKASSKHVKGQVDHVDAWLMSYADLITLLFMFFVIFVSTSLSRHSSAAPTHGEPVHPYVEEHSGLMALGTPYDEMYGNLKGTVATANADQSVAVEKSEHGVWVDLSAVQLFNQGTAVIPAERLPLLKAMARQIKDGIPAEDKIEVAAYTDDAPLIDSVYANNWELAAMRAARIVTLLVDEGVDAGRLRAVNYAANQPVVPNQDAAGKPIEENRERNQRVVIRVEGVEKK